MDWGYAVPTTKCLSTICDSTDPEPPTCEPFPRDPPTSPIKIPSQSRDLNNCGSSNYICAACVGSNNGLIRLTLVSELTKEDNIIVPMGPTTENNPRPTIDSSPLHHTVCSMIPIQLIRSLAIYY